MIAAANVRVMFLVSLYGSLVEPRASDAPNPAFQASGESTAFWNRADAEPTDACSSLGQVAISVAATNDPLSD